MTIQCCVCNKVEEKGKWIYPKETPPKNVSHTYCPTCLKASLMAMQAERRAADKAVPVAI